ncbi:hypothetical protein [Mycobacterium sp. 852002-50816_SCH5313054-b]|nr:hypothetical protein [Mycobacterium sp. 852002-50816_SCH5313054-b]
MTRTPRAESPRAGWVVHPLLAGLALCCVLLGRRRSADPLPDR